MKKTFPYIVLIAALSLAGIAAYYSVFGLSKLFSAKATAVIIMASALEISKLVTATFLHRFWNKISILLKTYLTSAVIILMMITSLGIYGFLTSAYQTTSDELVVLDKQVNIIEMKKTRFQEQLNSYSAEKNQLANSISELTKGLSNNKIQWRDKETGQIITSTSSKTRKVLQGQLNDFKIQRNNVSLKIESLSDSITNLDLQVLDINTNSEVTSEVGPLKYISKISNMPMDNIVNYFVLAFIFVFDPLAILLLISANKAFSIVRDNSEEVRNPIEDYKDHFRPPHPSDAYEEDDERMNIIGQNGNDGLHYDSGSIEQENIYNEENKKPIQSEPAKQERASNAYWS